jgi:hypothetical protein
MAYALRDVEPARLHRRWLVASPGIQPTRQRKLALAVARVSQVEAELRLMLVEAQVSQLEARLSHLESELADVRTQRDILMRPLTWASPGGTAP